ncbi:MAG: hypothetical protein M1829_006228 [Trizodia sp. TS-e1964]|nr:MAG: hypothetical protein M1829_006228 [Trizodia sp. TS-e1964]
MSDEESGEENSLVYQESRMQVGAKTWAEVREVKLPGVPSRSRLPTIRRRTERRPKAGRWWTIYWPPFNPKDKLSSKS